MNTVIDIAAPGTIRDSASPARRGRRIPRFPSRHRAVRARTMLAVALAGILTAFPPAMATSQPAATSTAIRGHSPPSHAVATPGCEARFVWPLRGASHETVTAAFAPPARPWLPGHRGVDLSADTGAELVSPAQGTVSFAGRVGGKDVVSIKHGDGRGTTTYEPAVATVSVGAPVRRGEPFGHVEGDSDHCADRCLHWGLRVGDGYADPTALTRPRRIALKQ